MYRNITIYSILICFISTIFARRELYDLKCKRTCNTEEGSLDCWNTTTDIFTYGLSTTMIDFCQTILTIRNLTNKSWYNITRDMLEKQIDQYEIPDDVQQLTKENIKQIAISLLDRCFNASLSIISFEPSCPSCSKMQTTRIKQWRLSSIILISIALLFIFVILLLFSIQTYYIDRSHIPIK